MRIRIFSRRKMESVLTAGALTDAAIISFSDPPRPHRTPDDYAPIDFTGKCDRVFSVALHDRDPSALADVDLTVETFFPEVDALAAFIYAAWADGVDIICQCEYGQSRSAGCAAAILQHFGRRGVDIFADYRYYPNQLVYHKVLDALDKYRADHAVGGALSVGARVGKGRSAARTQSAVMPPRLSAETFFGAFVTAVTDGTGRYVPYRGHKDFTNRVVRPSMEKIITRQGFLSSSEYYTVDYTAWVMPTEAEGTAEESAAREHGFRPCRWDMVAAIEHENHAATWNYEVLKLAPFTCDLRVVIGYSAAAHRWEAGSPLSDEARLAYTAGLLGGIRTLAPTDAGHEFLVMIGNDGSRDADAPEAVRGRADYVGYLYRSETGKFEKCFVDK